MLHLSLITKPASFSCAICRLRVPSATVPLTRSHAEEIEQFAEGGREDHDAPGVHGGGAQLHGSRDRPEHGPYERAQLRYRLRYGCAADGPKTSARGHIHLVPTVGLEPTWPCGQRILSPLRMPISPRRLALVSRGIRPLPRVAARQTRGGEG